MSPRRPKPNEYDRIRETLTPAGRAVFDILAPPGHRELWGWEERTAIIANWIEEPWTPEDTAALAARIAVAVEKVVQ